MLARVITGFKMLAPPSKPPRSHVPQCCTIIYCRNFQAVVCHEAAVPTKATQASDGKAAQITLRNFLSAVWKRLVSRDCSEMAAYAAIVLQSGPRWPVSVPRNAVDSRGSQFLLKACNASTFLQARIGS